MSNNKDGFDNELDIIKYINSKNNFNNMNDNMQKFLLQLFNDINIKNQTIFASKPVGFPKNIKPDIVISALGKQKFVSIKKGSGNSVHQEDLKDFTKYLLSIGISEETIFYLREFHYGDGTIDGSGATRISAKEFKNKYPEKIKQINLEFNNPEILKKLFNRFLFIGNIPNAPIVDMIYYGSVDKGIWAKNTDVEKYLLNCYTNKEAIMFSQLSYQVWNRCLNFNPKTENRRHIMQIKWASLENDLTNITKQRSNNFEK